MPYHTYKLYDTTFNIKRSLSCMFLKLSCHLLLEALVLTSQLHARSLVLIPTCYSVPNMYRCLYSGCCKRFKFSLMISIFVLHLHQSEGKSHEKLSFRTQISVFQNNLVFIWQKISRLETPQPVLPYSLHTTSYYVDKICTVFSCL